MASARLSYCLCLTLTGLGLSACSSGSGGDEEASGPSTSESAEAGEAETSGDGDGDASGDGDGDGDGDGPLILRNDSFEMMGSAAFQGGFVVDECFASTFEAAAQDYPFAPVSVIALLGGMDTSTVTMTVQWWEVDASGMPETMVDESAASFTGSDMAFNEANFASLSLAVPATVSDGAFAVAICHDAHAGAPSIARDADGITANKNWIFTTAGWADAGSLGVDGDWIMRVSADPAP